MALHIGGLSSGTDYESMIEQLMEARRVPIQLKEDKKTELDYDLGAWAEVNTKGEALTKTLDKLRAFDLWRSMEAESSLESVATATAAVASNEQSYTLSVTQMAAAQSISSNPVDTSSDLIAMGYASVGNTFDIEGETITIDAGETLSTLRTKINSAALNMPEGRRVQASLVNNHLVLTREDTGAGSISLSDLTGNVLAGMGVLDGLGAVNNENVTGRDAQFSVNGIAVTRASNKELEDVVDGLTINLKGVGTTTLDIHPDRVKVKETILEFIENYNAMAELVDDYSKIEQGSSSELSLKGELYGDSLISSIRTSLRQNATMQSTTLTALNAEFSYKGQTGVMNNLSDIGIWTSSDSNRLELVDESRLDDLLEYEFDNVAQLFKGVYDATTVTFRGGVASDFYRYISNVSESLTGDVAQRIDSLTNKYDDLSDEVTEMESALDTYEQDLWDKFSGMEDSLANMNSQLDYLKQTFNSG